MYFADFLPPSMTCNIGMLSNFFSRNYDESDWFLEDFNNVMIDKIKDTFEHFGKDYGLLCIVFIILNLLYLYIILGEPEINHSFPSLPTMDFPEPNFAY